MEKSDEKEKRELVRRVFGGSFLYRRRREKRGKNV